MTPTPALMPLRDAPIGLFRSDGELCLKTEYRRIDGWIEAYIVSSGEAFWGPAPQTLASQPTCLVEPVDWEVVEGLSGVLEVALRRTQDALASAEALAEAFRVEKVALHQRATTAESGLAALQERVRAAQAYLRGPSTAGAEGEQGLDPEGGVHDSPEK